jgi:hypothetical protein
VRTDENNQPVETPVEKVKKYPGFDETTGIYTTQNTQILTPTIPDTDKSDKILIPKGTKLYLSDKTKNTTLKDPQMIVNKGINPNKYKIKTTLTDVLPSNIPITYFPAAKKEKISLADKIYYNQISFYCGTEPESFDVENTISINEGEPKYDYFSTYTNETLSKILSDIFCKGSKTKTLKEIKEFDNTK